MKEVVLNGSLVRSRAEVHRLLAEGFGFPAWYGNNLDALYDCLTDLREEVSIRVLEVEAMEESLGAYARRLMRVLCDASSENPRIQLTTE